MVRARAGIALEFAAYLMRAPLRAQHRGYEARVNTTMAGQRKVFIVDGMIDKTRAQVHARTDVDIGLVDFCEMDVCANPRAIVLEFDEVVFCACAHCDDDTKNMMCSAHTWN